MNLEQAISRLNPQQQEAVKTTDGPLLVMAGAGSGKTSVLTTRVAYLVEEKHVNPWNILAITFTNKAAKEMRDRIEVQLGEVANDIWISTFHALCVRILRREAETINFSRSFTIADPAEQLTLVKRILKRLNYDPKQYDPKSILGQISNAKNELIDPDTFQNKVGSPFDRVVGEVYQDYQKNLQRDQTMDFDDLIMNTIMLFKLDKPTLHFYQNKFQFVSVDEYQDTNEAQYQLVNMLAAQYRNLCVVGDADQSIYGWRGANMENILNFEEDYPEAKTIMLEQNYRSTGHVLSAANDVIDNNANRKPKELWTDQGKGEPITYYRAQSESDEAGYIASKVKEAVETGDRKYQDFAVLYRTNAQSRSIEEGLIKQGIHYRIVGGHKFYDRKEIKDILSYLRLITNPADSLSVNRVINTPKRGVGPGTLDKLTEFSESHGWSLFEGMQNIALSPIGGKVAKTISEFAQFLVDTINYSAEHSVTGITEKILEDSGYAESLRLQKTLEADTRLENIDEFLSVTKKFDDSYEPTEESTGRLSDFLAEVSLLSDQDDLENQDDQMALMTLHAAKGLEFPVVFLVGLEEGIFPSARTLLDENEVEEERRLAYVGITRARQKLYLINTYSRLLYGRTQNNAPSRFIGEISDEDLETENTTKMSDVFLRNNTPKPRMGRSVQAPFTSQNDRATATVYRSEAHKKTAKAAGSVGAEKAAWSVGDKAIHKAWGEGTVVSVAGNGEDLEMDIAFPNEGIKHLLAAFAPIKKG